jgi:hypothetical protein
MFYSSKRIYHPEYYHGPYRPRRYFEGWYYKVVSRNSAFAVIPGVSWAPSDPHAFIQTIDGESGRASYHRFDVGAFSASRSKFEVKIGESVFTLDGMTVRTNELEVDLTFDSLVRWPSSLFSPGTMGWYSFVPFMECRHGILVMDARARGTVAGAEIRDARLYVEKDYGRSFPSGWIWGQTNSFPEPGVSVTMSIANVPFLGGAFSGFLIGLLHGGEVHRFTTYTGAKVASLAYDDGGAQIVIRDSKKELQLSCRRASGSVLAAPRDGEMLGRIEESLRSTISVRLLVDGRVEYEGTGEHAGLEMVNPEVLYPSR